MDMRSTVTAIVRRTRTAQGSQDVILAGGFRCNLTNQEVNLWSEFIESNAKFQQLQKLSSKVQTARILRQGEETGIEEALNQMTELNKDLFQISKNWVSQTVPAERISQFRLFNPTLQEILDIGVTNPADEDLVDAALAVS